MPTAVAPINLPWTTPITQKDGKVSHAWQRAMTDLWRKLGGSGNMAPITADNIYGILASINMVANAQLNTTNFCNVDSVDNGTNGTIRVYGTAGVGTTWTRLVGTTTYGPFPSLSQAGFAYGSTWDVLYDPSSGSFLTTQSFAESLADQLIWCGRVTVVNSGGGGGTTGGGGGGGNEGGCTEVGTPLYFEHTDSAEMELIPNSEWIELRFTEAERPLRVHPDTLVSVWVKAKELNSGELIDAGGDGQVLPLHSVRAVEFYSHKQKMNVFPDHAYRAGSRKVRLHNRKII